MRLTLRNMIQQNYNRIESLPSVFARTCCIQQPDSDLNREGHMVVADQHRRSRRSPTDPYGAVFVGTTTSEGIERKAAVVMKCG
jgi:hypothetical protein